MDTILRAKTCSYQDKDSDVREFACSYPRYEDQSTCVFHASTPNKEKDFTVALKEFVENEDMNKRRYFFRGFVFPSMSFGRFFEKTNKAVVFHRCTFGNANFNDCEFRSHVELQSAMSLGTSALAAVYAPPEQFSCHVTFFDQLVS